MDKLRTKSGFFRQRSREAEKQRNKEAGTASQGLKDSLHPYIRISLLPSLRGCSLSFRAQSRNLFKFSSAKPIPKLKTKDLKLKTPLPGFTLVEVLIVVAILGILAAIVVPLYEDNQQKAKESAAKENLRVLRNAIELYAAQHKGAAPGYLNSNNPSINIFIAQLTKATNSSGTIAALGTIGYPLGPYINTIPKNPFNDKSSITLIQGINPIPTATEDTGWFYRPLTKTITINHFGTDSEEKDFSTY